MTDPIEIELKLEFDPADRRRLGSAPALKGAAGKTRHLVSTYFDTPDNDLLAAGYTLRVRRNGAQHIQTVKAAGDQSAGLFVRPEWECALADDRPRFDPDCGPLAEALGAPLLERIGPVFTTDMRRAACRIEQDGATIELAVDKGAVRAGECAESLCEVELELRDGSPAALFDLARQLNERVPLRLGVRSKSERGYALLADTPPAAVKAEPILLDRTGDAGDAFQAIAQACIRHFRLNEALLLPSGGVEPLHQARVGLRRLRSALSLYGPFLAEGGPPPMLRSELRWLAAELGEVRNIDVLARRFDGDVRDRLAAARTQRFDQVRDELASARTRLLMLDLAEWLALDTWRTGAGEALDRAILPFAHDLLDRQRARVKRLGKGLAGLGPRHRHAVRIEVKKLRYAAEFFAALYPAGKPARRHARFIATIETLQDLLGELNDIAVAPDLLAQLGIDAVLPKAGKRKHLLDAAEQAYDALIHARRFWRGEPDT
ncbi:CHAD domain-containing protein [Sphingomonas sp. ZT3P38]|uniref:CYTH and CHAD domain-containing protein n=1 Tax=Parasphingomonas zepuensis TaxID=3096161 RepID=UPI002FC9BA95